MASRSSANGHTVWLPLGKLKFDPEIQRKLNRPRADKIAAALDLDALGVIQVSERDDGHYVIDGQHRCEALKAFGFGPNEKVECKVHRGLDKAAEAALMTRLNRTAKLRLIDDFRIRVVATDPEAVAINHVVEGCGLRVSENGLDGVVRAPQSLEKIYRGDRSSPKRENPEALRNTLNTITGAWGSGVTALNGEVILGVGLVFLRYNGQVDVDDLTKRLASMSGGPSGLLGKGRTMREMRGGSTARGVASVVVDAYNKGRRSSKLPDWWSKA